jgi:hypothetical protein
MSTTSTNTVVLGSRCSRTTRSWQEELSSDARSFACSTRMLQRIFWPHLHPPLPTRLPKGPKHPQAARLCSRRDQTFQHVLNPLFRRTFWPVLHPLLPPRVPGPRRLRAARLCPHRDQQPSHQLDSAARYHRPHRLQPHMRPKQLRRLIALSRRTFTRRHLLNTLLPQSMLGLARSGPAQLCPRLHQWYQHARRCLAIPSAICGQTICSATNTSP